MADFVCHGALGAGIMGGIGRALKLNNRWVDILGIYGFLVGIWADAFDAIVAWLGLYPRWFWYVIYHHDPPVIWGVQPPFALHVFIVDPIFHSIPGENWWYRLWWLAILLWLVAFVLIWIVWKTYIKRLYEMCRTWLQ